MQELNNQTLGRLPATIGLPEYDRRAVTVGIAHIDVGNFHRTHQAVYIDRCLHLSDHQHWGVIGIGLTDSATGAEKAEVITARMDSTR